MTDSFRVGTTTTGALPTVPRERRQEILALPQDRATHLAVWADLPFLDHVETCPVPGTPVPLAASARIAAWNTERCMFPEPSIALIREMDADVTLLCEMDLGMARSHQLHSTQVLAERLGQGHAYAIEFLELGLGDEVNQLMHEGEENHVGYHGGAILARTPLRRPAVLRLESEGEWWSEERGQRRVGGRIAVAATIEVAGVDVTVVSVHLESHSDPIHRGEQMAVLLAAIDAYSPDAPVVIGGDVNTLSVGLADFMDPERLAQCLQDDPARYINPVPHEPLFRCVEEAGYDWRACNIIGESTQRVHAPPPSAKGLLKLDWFFTRGLAVEAPAIVPAVDPETGRAISDHEALVLSVRPATCGT